MDAATAQTFIERFTAWDNVPALTAGEVESLVALAAAERPWAASTPYILGSYVVPVTANEHRYLVTIEGTSDATEPVAWGTAPATEVTSGGAVFVEAGEPTWDVYGAAAVGWEWKAARVAGGYDFGRGEQTWRRSQMYAHCMKQADRYWARSSGVVRAAAGPSSVRGARTITIAPPERLIAYDEDEGLIRARLG